MCVHVRVQCLCAVLGVLTWVGDAALRERRCLLPATTPTPSILTTGHAGRHGAQSGQAGTYPLASGWVQVCIMRVCSVPTCHRR